MTTAHINAINKALKGKLSIESRIKKEALNSFPERREVKMCGSSQRREREREECDNGRTITPLSSSS